MRTIKGTVFLTAGIVAAIAAVGMGDTINRASNGWLMIEYAFASVTLIVIALVLCAFGVNAENKKVEQERLRKIARVQSHTNEWRDAQ